MLYKDINYVGQSVAHRFDITLSHPHHINAIHVYCNEEVPLPVMPAEFFVTAVDEFNRLIPLVREHYHNVFSTPAKPYWMKLKTNEPIRRLFIEVLSR